MEMNMRRVRRALLFGALVAVLGGLAGTGCGDDAGPTGPSVTQNRGEQEAGPTDAAPRGAHTTSDD
jgi:hypothetical protein